MKTFRKLQRLSSKEELPRHFNTVVASIERVLGSGSVDPSHYLEADLYAEKYLGYNLRRKEATPFGVKASAAARQAETLVGFLLRETVNKKINSQWTFGYDPRTGEYSSDLLGCRLLYDARDIIHRILGESPNLENIVRKADFGNGASATLSRRDAQRQRKFEHGLSATSGLLAFAEKLVNSSHVWRELVSPQDETIFIDTRGNTSLRPGTLKRVLGAVLDYVSKTKDIDRIILKEPELNGFVQKGIGREIRSLLRLFTEFAPDGVDLNTSGTLNNELAQAGSLDGHIATVDGERASDSITLALCEFLFPEAWYKLLCAARSPYAIIDGKLHRLQMMSGMGNGFTFELESVIFYAIGIACAKRSKLPFAELYVSIHGDDLTVPADVFRDVVLAYRAAGIKVNESKSFSQGPFRESCGGHYFLGKSVKPFYVKTSTGLTRGDWCWLANSLLLWLLDRSDTYLASAKGRDLLQILQHLRMYATSNSRLYVTSFCRSRRSGIFGPEPVSQGSSYKIRNIVDVARVNRFTDHQAYAAWLCSPQVSPTVQDILFGSARFSDPYKFNEEVDERERWVRLNTWLDVCKEYGRPSLWASLSPPRKRQS